MDTFSITPRPSIRLDIRFLSQTIYAREYAPHFIIFKALR